tara:strand:+ start:1085 stop:1435 length:351 start_codon:yes stop_codon:yes gene_type:complete
MSITTSNISELVRMLLRGIKSPVPIDPIAAADAFQVKIDEHGADYPHYNGCGYLYHNGDDVMLVHFTGDGVEFDDHAEHPMTLDFIRIALDVLQEQQLQTSSVEVDEDSDDDMEWI